MIETVNPDTLPSPVLDLYAQVTIVPSGRLAFVSGQVALNRSGELVGAGDHAAQARKCFENLALAVEAVGAEPDYIVKMSIHVVGHHPDLIEPIFSAGADAFKGDWPCCASTFIGVEALGLPEWLVEVDAVIALPSRQSS